MTRNKRMMVRILDPEEFEKNKQALLKFDTQLVELGQTKSSLSNAKVLRLMSRTCAGVWRDGADLYIVSQERVMELIARHVVAAVDDNISEVVKMLATWLELKITYQRQGSVLSFRFQKASGEARELQIPMRRPEPPESVPGELRGAGAWGN